jgi:pyruvate dehydrogenase E2 component (dihydrolipoamide acetyltransferase)
MADPIEIRVPDLGGFADVPVIDVLVKEGDRIEVDTPLITLETEKATMDVPSTAAGQVSAVKIKKGQKVSRDSVILLLQASGDAPAAQPAAQAAPAAAPKPVGDSEPTVRQPALASKSAGAGAPARSERAPSSVPLAAVPMPASEPIHVDFSKAHASPSVRKFARELGVNLTLVSGTGIKGRITPEDVKAWVKRALTGGAQAPAGGGALPRLPVVDYAKFGPVEVQPLSRIQKIAGPRLQASWVNLPHVTQFDLADFTEVEEARTQLKGKAVKEGIKLTPVAFVIRACVKALQEFPQFNASLDASGENLVLKKYMHIGFAADTPHGLVVPVIRDTDRKDIYEIARELGTLADKARAGKLTPQDLQGGCFTVSSLGAVGGTAFTPIINAPEVAILGVSKASFQPVYRDGNFVPRLMLPLSLSYDHRVIDGVLAARFTTFLVKVLSDARGLVEAVPKSA